MHNRLWSNYAIILYYSKGLDVNYLATEIVTAILTMIVFFRSIKPLGRFPCITLALNFSEYRQPPIKHTQDTEADNPIHHPPPPTNKYPPKKTVTLLIVRRCQFSFGTSTFWTFSIHNYSLLLFNKRITIAGCLYLYKFCLVQRLPFTRRNFKYRHDNYTTTTIFW